MPDLRVDEFLDRLTHEPLSEATPLDKIAARARRVRRRRRSWRIGGAVSVLAAASVLVAVVVSVGGRSSTKVSVRPSHAASHIAPLADPTLIPAGWSPISLGAIQISVPSGWFIENPGDGCPTGQDGPQAELQLDGVVFINQTPSLQGACPLPANVVELSAASQPPPTGTHRAVINTIPVLEASTTNGTAYNETIRALGMQLYLTGPLATQVLATLTHSPLSVVLDSTVNTMPAGWQEVHFGGLIFDVPPEWTIDRVSMWPFCPGNIAANVLVLSTAQFDQASSCGGGPPPTTAGDLAARPGMVVGSGPQVTSAPSNATCVNRRGLRICVDPAPPSNEGFVSGQELNLLTAQVMLPGQKVTAQIEIGLTGTGLAPLQIFDSMRAEVPPESVANRPRCQSAFIKGAVAGAINAAGTVSAFVTLTNTGQDACSVGGYPVVRFYTSDGKPITVAVQYGGPTSTPGPTSTASVGLLPGETAYFQLEYGDAVLPCTDLPTLEISDPLVGKPILITLGIQTCAGPPPGVYVTPLASDTGLPNLGHTGQTL